MAIMYICMYVCMCVYVCVCVCVCACVCVHAMKEEKTSRFGKDNRSYNSKAVVESRPSKNNTFQRFFFTFFQGLIKFLQGLCM